MTACRSRLASGPAPVVARFPIPVSLLPLPLLLALSLATAQSSAILDEGTLLVTKNGAPIGRESFRLIREIGPGGQQMRARGTFGSGDTRVVTNLGADSSGGPVTYEAELTQKGQLVERIQGRGRPGRFSVLISTKSGESAREYVLSHGALLLDGSVFHQFFFVPLAAVSEITVISPRDAVRARLRLEERGTEQLTIGGRSIRARHVALVDSTGAGRELWVDPLGRLLKVSIPALGLVAVRDDPPR